MAIMQCGYRASEDVSACTTSLALLILRSCVHPFCIRHHVLCPQLGDNRVEMLDIEHLKVDRNRGEIRGWPFHANIADVAVVLGDDLGYLCERAGFINRLKYNASRKALRRALVDVPAQIEPTLGHILEVLQRRRLDRVDGDSLAGGENADNAVARNRAAVGREAHRQISIDAADGNCRARLASDVDLY